MDFFSLSGNVKAYLLLLGQAKHTPREEVWENGLKGLGEAQIAPQGQTGNIYYIDLNCQDWRAGGRARNRDAPLISGLFCLTHMCTHTQTHTDVRAHTHTYGSRMERDIWKSGVVHSTLPLVLPGLSSVVGKEEYFTQGPFPARATEKRSWCWNPRGSLAAEKDLVCGFNVPSVPGGLGRCF